jgi:hypothetical protein
VDTSRKLAYTAVFGLAGRRGRKLNLHQFRHLGFASRVLRADSLRKCQFGGGLLTDGAVETDRSFFITLQMVRFQEERALERLRVAKGRLKLRAG